MDWILLKYWLCLRVEGLQQFLALPPNQLVFSRSCIFMDVARVVGSNATRPAETERDYTQH